MPRSFALSVESPAGVEHILAAFGDQQYWKARLAAFDNGTATLDGLTVEADGVVTVALMAVFLFGVDWVWSNLLQMIGVLRFRDTGGALGSSS